MKTWAIIIIVGVTAAPLVAGERSERASFFSLAAEQERPSLAEQCLLDLADASRRARTVGYISLGIGAAITAGGIAVLSGFEDPDDIGDFFEALGGLGLAAAGAATMISGLTTIALAGGPVRRWATVRSLTDAGARERASREALSSLAHSGRTKRLILAGICSALAAYALVGTSEPQAALLPGGLAVFQLLSKSREERAYAGFLASEGMMSRGTVGVGLGPGPRGGFRVALTASF